MHDFTWPTRISNISSQRGLPQEEPSQQLHRWLNWLCMLPFYGPTPTLWHPVIPLASLSLSQGSAPASFAKLGQWLCMKGTTGPPHWDICLLPLGLTHSLLSYLPQRRYTLLRTAKSISLCRDAHQYCSTTSNSRRALKDHPLWNNGT